MSAMQRQQCRRLYQLQTNPCRRYRTLYSVYGYGAPTYEQESTSCGSGIIIGKNDSELLICTNNHVVENSTELSVGFADGSVCEAVVKGTDASNDLAVVAVKLDDISSDTMDAIKVAEIGDSDKLVVGQQVVAIGNDGYGQSVTTGIVSALNRTIGRWISGGSDPDRCSDQPGLVAGHFWICRAESSVSTPQGSIQRR